MSSDKGRTVLEWRKVRYLPIDWGGDRAGHTATQIGHKVYVVGGYSDELGRDTLQPQYCVLDTQKLEWELVHPEEEVKQVLPDGQGFQGEGACYHTATLVDDRILLLGGYNEAEFVPFTEFRVRFFDPITNTVTRQHCNGSLPSSRFRHVAGYFEQRDEVVIFGGTKGSLTKVNELFAFHVRKMECTAVIYRGNPPSPQSSHVACMQSNLMFIYCHRELCLFTLKFFANRAYWSDVKRIGDIVPATYGGSLNVMHGKLVLFGGYVSEQVHRGLYLFDLATGIWAEVAEEPAERSSAQYIMEGDLWPTHAGRHVGVVVKSTIMLIGGSGRRLDSSWALHVTSS